MESQIIKQSEIFVTDLFKKGLTEDHRYHSLAHTIGTRDAAITIGKRYRFTDDELETLNLASLFHDTGFIKKYLWHEDVSKEIAAEFFKDKLSPERITLINSLIEVTKLGVEPKTMLEKVMKDADYNNNDASYADKAIALRHEWKVFLDKEMTEREWLENNAQFWEGHQFYTGEGLALFGEEKRKTLKKINKQLEKMGSAPSKPVATAPKPAPATEDFNDAFPSFAINASKTAQMMFKTTLRNHVDLTNIADNKANIMLSINSLLITLGIPMMATNLEKFPNLVYPGAALLTTCILSIVFATLATRPVKMPGYTDVEKVGKSNTNLFFFGNFYKMNFADYKEGLHKVTASEEVMDDTVVTDLFWLGKALGAKFTRLRHCYSIFMVGMIVTVMAFAFAFMVK